MANQKTERMDKEVRNQIIRILSERAENPMLDWSTVSFDEETPEWVAAGQLREAGFLSGLGYITLAGQDYHREETKRFRWLRANGFPVFVAVLTSVATLGAGIITVWFGNRAC